MKFAAGLIKIFSGLLSAFVFGAFLYYTYQYQTTKEADNLFTANIALAVFLISSVTFALLFILFDVYQNKNNESDLVKLLKGSDINKNTGNSNITDLLVKIATFNHQTNQLLDGHFKELTNGITNLNDKSEVNSTNFQNTLQQLTTICEEISQYVDGIKTENAKENQRNAGHSGNFDVLVATVSRLSSDLNDLNGRLLDVVNQISKNVTNSIQSHTNIDNEIKELLQKILLAKNSGDTFQTVPETPAPEHFEDLANEQYAADKPVSLDLEDEEPVSLDLPNEESNVKLDDIFNDDFASEMADLDILKDNTNNQNTGEISVEDLLADDNDPYNPNK